jgi:FkbM family methyltransferase
MNRFERAVGEVDPGLSVRLRALKLRFRHDIARRLIQAMIRPGEVCIDVGANRGVYTHLMSVQVGSGGHVHAVEPFPANYERLRTLARRRGNVIVHTLALSDRSGSALLHFPVHDGHPIDALASLEGNGTQKQDSCVVSLSTLDELLEGERRVSFVKCDVEGHEQRVFDGATRTFGRDRPIVFAEVEQRHRADPIENTFAFFAGAGYCGWLVVEGGLRPLEEFDVVRHQLGFLGDRFVPYAMPDGYVYDFLFCPPGTMPPSWSLGRHERLDGPAGQA